MRSLSPNEGVLTPVWFIPVAGNTFVPVAGMPTLFTLLVQPFIGLSAYFAFDAGHAGAQPTSSMTSCIDQLGGPVT